MISAKVLKNQKQIIQKYEVNALEGSIDAMVTSIALRKQNNQSESPEVFNEEDSVSPERRGIAAMAAATKIKIKRTPLKKMMGVPHRVV